MPTEGVECKLLFLT